MMKVLKVLKVGAGVIYLLFLFYVVFFARRRESMQETRRRELINVVPVVNQVKTYSGLAPKDKKGRRHFLLNIVGNVFLFLPLPFLFYSLGIREQKRILILAFLSTSGIEAIQLFFHIGVPDVDDVLLNMTGAILGVLLLKQLPVPMRLALYKA